MPRKKKIRSPEILARDIAKAIWGSADDVDITPIQAVIEKTFDPAGTLKFTLDHPMLWWWRAKVVSVTDGDTMDVFLDRGFRDTHHERVRLHRVNAWETRGKERPQGLKASRWAKKILTVNREILVHTTGPDDRGNFGRWLAQLWVPLTEEESEAFAKQFLVDGKFPKEIAARLLGMDDARPYGIRAVNLGEWMLELGHARPYKKK